GLRGPAFLAEGLHALLDDLARGGFALQDRAQGNVAFQERTTAVFDVHLARLTLEHFAVVIHKTDRLDHIEHPRAHGPRVHAQRATDAAGDALQKFEARQPVPPGFHSQGFQSRAGAAMQSFAVDFHPAEVWMPEAYHDATDPAVLDEQVRAAPENHEGKPALLAEPEQRAQFGFGSRLDIKVRRTADAQSRFPRQRFVAPED